MSKFKLNYVSYPNYKKTIHSNIKKLPANWRFIKLSQLGSLEAGTSFPYEYQGRQDKEIPFYKVADMNHIENQRYMRTAENTVSLKDMISLNARLKKRGTIIFPKVGAALLTNKRRILSRDSLFDNNIMGFYPRIGIVEYYYYFFQCLDLKYLSNPGPVPSVNESQLKSMMVPYPSEDEQKFIANFLDKETTKIDNLIEKKQRLIELLQEKRQALITNAVTKGLDPSVPMKDSGIPWLGEVPEHWDLKKLKYITRMVGGSTPSKDNLEFWNGDIPWVSPKDMKVDFIHTSQDYITQLGVINNNLELVPENSTLIVVRSGILKHTLPVVMTKIEVTLNQDMKALIPKSNFLISEYLFWMFKGLAKSVLNNSWKIGATVDSIEIELLENLFFPIPSREEQQTIINYLESRTLKINKLISKLQTQITRLQEYRQALITAAVTGKIDVREKVSL